MHYEIFSERTDVNACNCSQGVRTAWTSLHWKLTLEEKSLAALGNRTCVSSMLVRDTYLGCPQTERWSYTCELLLIPGRVLFAPPLSPGPPAAWTKGSASRLACAGTLERDASRGHALWVWSKFSCRCFPGCQGPPPPEFLLSQSQCSSDADSCWPMIFPGKNAVVAV